MAPHQLARRLRRRVVLFALVVALVGVVAALGCNGAGPVPTPVGTGAAANAQAASALSGNLDVVVRRPDRGSEPFVVVEKGALPVVPGGVMSLLVQFNEPAYTYLVWLDCREQALPLYPWNTKILEVTDLGQPPPVLQPAKVLYSPILGGGWTFGEKGGLETVLLLARRTPLPADVDLTALIKPIAHAPVQSPTELTILGLDGGADTPTILHPAGSADQQSVLKPEDPLGPLLISLGKHFELIRAVRFAHVGE